MPRMIQTLAAVALSGVLAMVLLLVPATSATAARFWKNSVVTGNWTSGSNWIAVSATGIDNAGAPVTNDTVNIRPTDDGDHTVTYDVGSPLTLTQLNVELTGAGATTTTFSMSMSTNNLISSNEWVGINGRGTFKHSGGTNTLAGGHGFP